MPSHDESEHTDARKDHPTKQWQVIARKFSIQNTYGHPGELLLACKPSAALRHWRNYSEIVNPATAVVSIPFVMLPGAVGAAISYIDPPRYLRSPFQGSFARDT